MPNEIRVQQSYYAEGKHEFDGQISFSKFSYKSSQCDKRSNYYPLVVHAVCQNPSVPNSHYSRILYFDFNMSSAAVRLI